MIGLPRGEQGIIPYFEVRDVSSSCSSIVLVPTANLLHQSCYETQCETDILDATVAFKFSNLASLNLSNLFTTVKSLYRDSSYVRALQCIRYMPYDYRMDTDLQKLDLRSNKSVCIVPFVEKRRMRIKLQSSSLISIYRVSVQNEFLSIKSIFEIMCPVPLQIEFMSKIDRWGLCVDFDYEIYTGFLHSLFRNLTAQSTAETTELVSRKFMDVTYFSFDSDPAARMLLFTALYNARIVDGRFAIFSCSPNSFNVGTVYPLNSVDTAVVDSKMYKFYASNIKKDAILFNSLFFSNEYSFSIRSLTTLYATLSYASAHSNKEIVVQNVDAFDLVPTIVNIHLEDDTVQYRGVRTILDIVSGLDFSVNCVHKKELTDKIGQKTAVMEIVYKIVTNDRTVIKIPSFRTYGGNVIVRIISDEQPISYREIISMSNIYDLYIYYNNVVEDLLVNFESHDPLSFRSIRVDDKVMGTLNIFKFNDRTIEKIIELQQLPLTTLFFVANNIPNVDTISRIYRVNYAFNSLISLSNLS